MEECHPRLFVRSVVPTIADVSSLKDAHVLKQYGEKEDARLGAVRTA